MREIKFRGKRVDNGKWVYGYYSKFDNDTFIGVVENIRVDKENNTWENVINKYVVIPETVGQYTGLKDKNGVEIYEGDKLKVGGKQ